MITEINVQDLEREQHQQQQLPQQPLAQVEDDKDDKKFCVGDEVE
jgi:hypothetical protein